MPTITAEAEAAFARAKKAAVVKPAPVEPVKPVFVPTLRLANHAQKVLFEAELKGQLSDGAWENASPSDHWEPWCKATVVVAEDGQKVGRNFWARKTGYAFAKELIEVVGDRMMEYVRAAYAAGTSDHVRDFENVEPDGTISKYVLEYAAKYEADPVKYRYYDTYVALRDRLQQFDLKAIAAAKANEALYDEKALRKDLAAINRAMKEWF